MIFDAHTHVWPDRIAGKALAGRVPGLTPVGDGTVAGLDAAMAAAGVDRAVALSVADQARHVEAANRFAGSLRSERLLPFGTVHVEAPVEENLASLRRHRLTGVKLHPLFQGFALDDRRLWEILAALGSELTVITHVGEGGDAAANRRATPQMVAAIAKAFPELPLVACHFGGYRRFEEACELLAGADVVLETSWPPSLAGLAPERVRRLVRRHGASRIVFGSDWPMTDPAAEIRAVERLGLTGAETEQVLGGNLARLTGE